MINGLAFLKDQVEKTRRNPARIRIIITNYGTLLLRHIAAELSRRLPAQKSEMRVEKPMATSSTAAAPEISKSNPFISEQVPPEVAELSARYKARRITNFLIGQRNLERHNAIIARSVCSFFDATESLKATFDEIFSQVCEFQRIYLDAPVTLNNYGVHFSTGLFLFLIARCRNPVLILESGVYKGLSTYFLSTACPRAVLYAFDPNLNELAFRSANATYHAMDWMSCDIVPGPVGSSLAFFDDHQCQARRVIQAYDRGFRHLIFDDSWPIESVHGCGWPPIPSIDMVMNSTLEVDETVQWIEGGKIWTYAHDREMQDLCAKARALISAAYDVPSLYRETGFGPTSAMKYVELVP
jgi:hypothetical protein